MTDIISIIGNNEAKVYGETLKTLPHDLYIPPDALEIYLDSFQGPLDLLLYLIRKNNIDILDIPMAMLTIQYMEYVEKMPGLVYARACVYACACVRARGQEEEKERGTRLRWQQAQAEESS